ncbi:hypothetical protein PISL3812_07268 [Talaromyces islandicus]|uniref:Uncharacterized protein n=1 Tax=Talaromyces islandicus TaxID=28573 RepID=A0A0U1M3U1_TALIS|nr:hypothetical protein PISL3812_07268 [Talaromyces islandicus]
MPEDQPRRILEKSRTVRRKYQRSNKRFQFTASQIQQIEREEEREKRARQLRDREKKKLANKRKKAEKEAHEREERKRLGLPHPDGLKITASQPLMLNFFGKKKEKEQEEQEPTESCFEEAVDVPLQDTTEDKAAQLEDDDIETEFEDDWFGDNWVLEEHSQSRNNAISEDLSVSHALNSDCGAGAPGDNKSKTSLGELDPLYVNVNKIGESFEDDTAHLLEELDPTAILQTAENTEPILQDCQTPNKASKPHAIPSPSRADPGTEISEKDDYKENWHPNFPRDGRQIQQPPQPTTPRHNSSQSQISHSSGPRQVLDILSSHGSNDEVGQDTVSPKKDQHALKEPQNDHAESNNEVPFEIHVDTEDDEYGDLNLSTQELKDLDDMAENNA